MKKLPRRHQRHRFRNCLSVVLSVAFVLCLGIWSIHRAISASLLNGRFPKTIAYQRPERRDIKPYIYGRLTIIDVNRRAVDDLWFQLPENRRARTDSEVDTIVLIKWRRRGATEDNPNPETNWIGEVEVVDPSIPAVLGCPVEFYGSWHLSSSRPSNRTVYDRPESTVLNYLLNLPREKTIESEHPDPPKLKKELEELDKLLKP